MEPQVSKLLSGGLNLLAAGDAVPEGQALTAQNVRTDQAGTLRSRKSNSAAIYSLPDSVTSIITALRSSGPARYFGAGTNFYRGASAVQTGLSGGALQLVSFQDRVWLMDPLAQKKDDGTNLFPWTPQTAPVPVLNSPGGGGSLNGVYNYYVTGVTDEGEETGSAGAATTSSLTNNTITVNVPTFTDAQVTQWNVYRSGGSFPLQAYKLNASPLPLSTTTYLDNGQDNSGSGGDNQTDLGLAELGVTLPVDRQPAPPAKGLAGPYFGKLIAFNSADHPNRFWWTPSDEPYHFPGSTSNQDGNWADIGEEGEQILAVAIYPRMAIFFKERSVHRLVGDPDDLASDLERTNAEIGLLGAKAWSQAGSLLYAQGLEGVYVGAGTFDQIQKLTKDIDPLFKSDSIFTIGTTPAVAASSSPTTRSLAVSAWRNGRLYFSYPSASATANDTTLVMDEGKWFTDSRAFTALYDEGQTGYLLGAIGGNVYELETGTQEANIPVIYQSRYENQGAPENQKRYSDILIEHNTGGRTFTAYAYLDNGATVITLGTFTSTAWTQTTFTLGDDENPVEHRNISIRLESDTGNAIAEIYTIIAHYLPMERGARTYDTGRIPLEKASLVGTLELDLEILSGSVTYYLQAGFSALAEISKGTFTGPAVETFTAQPPDGTEARWLRLLLFGDNFRCRGARIKLLPYGLYLTGSGDIFRTGDLTFGSPREKLLQQIRVDCDPDGAIAGELYTDTPAPLSGKVTLGLAASSGRAWQRQTFPPNTRGRVNRIEFTSTAVCRIYAIQVRAKVLGEPGGWEWADVPVPETPQGFSWMNLPL